MPDEPIENASQTPVPEAMTSHAASADESIAKKFEGEYNEDSIQVLEGLEAVRRRPGMYVGDNGKKGLHQMFREVIDNAVDEALAGFCDNIIVTHHADGSMSVRDNGRGIPVGKHEKMGVSTLEVVMTVLHAGGKFGEGGGYKVSGGLHGVGVSCTNALSEWLEATITRDGKKWFQRYLAGVPVEPVKSIGKGEGTGSLIHWKPDASVLTETKHDMHIIVTRLRELAYLNPKVRFELIDEENPDNSSVFHFHRGIQQLVEDVNEGKNTLHRPVYFKRIKESYELEVALQYHDGYNGLILAFSNNIHQPDGGTHVSGFSAALTRVINSYARKNNILKEKDKNFTSEDVMDGLTAVISLKLENPSYNSQDKVKLVTPEVQGMVNSLVGDGLQTFFDEHPREARAVVDKALIAQRAREAARKAAEAVKRSSAMDSFGLPGKLSDCISKEATRCELFLVEGDSAGGSAKDARDRNTQAVLPLRGKILNVERARVDKALDNEEIKSLIAALGVGFDLDIARRRMESDQVVEEQPVEAEVGSEEAPTEAPTEAPSEAPSEANEDIIIVSQAKGKEKNDRNSSSNFDLSKLRYHKVIIMTDADVDGEHIRTLLLTFFYRYMRPLIEEGHIYLAQPPLYVVKAGANDRFYAQDESERDEIVKNLRSGRKRDSFTITRFKGLGEMNANELEETTMAPEKRRLVQVKLDPEFVTEVETMFSKLMGDKVEPRREFIERHAKEALDLDWHY